MKRRRIPKMCTLGAILLFLLSGFAIAQNTTVTGAVTDGSSGNPLPGVNVLIKGTSTGTVTDMEGKYHIEISNPDAVLQFSFVGYLTESVTVGGQTQIDITLVEDITTLNELVVIGYGTQRKQDLTGAVSVVSTENLEKIESGDIAKVLQGQTSGVQVFGGGEPGAMQQVQIRGISSFYNAGPLYVIDGVPIAPATNLNTSGQSFQFENNAPGYGALAPAGGINDFNPSDIESIQVLKDASAAAIYGARGANGVIIITTKRGKTGTMKINYEGNFGSQQIVKRLDMTHRVQFQELNNLARTNDGGIEAPVNNPDNPKYIDSIDTDWQKEVFKRGFITDQNLSIQGGSENATYYGGINYFNQTGTVQGRGPKYTKYSAQLNLDQKKGRIKIGESFSYTYSDQIRLTSSRWNNYMIELVQAIPTVQIYDNNNIGGYGGSSADYNQIAGNPIAFNNLKEASYQRHRFLGVIYGEVEIFKGLSYKINLSYDRSEWFNKEFIPVYNVGNRHTWETAYLNEWRGENPVMIMEHLLNYHKVIGKHDIAAVIGYTAQKDHIEDLYAHAEGFTEPYLQVISAISTGGNSLGTRYEHTMISYLGRVNYSYADKYLVTGSMRRDFSSNFGPNNKYGDFPSFALGWKISNEPFFSNIPFINLLKIRGGWGKIGNEKIPAYQYETTINNAATYVFYDHTGHAILPLTGSIQTLYTDPSIRWEERVTTNVGFDMAMLENKVEFSAEYYYNTTNDILMQYPIPISSGAVGWVVQWANGASMVNKGIEISASYKKFEGDFHYQLGGNLTTLKNEVTKIGTANLPIPGSSNEEANTSMTEVGGTMGELYGYVYEGIFQNADQINTVTPDNPAFDPSRHAFQHSRTQPGDVMFKDISGDGQITVDDKTSLGSPIPKFTYGLNASADYKGFDLSIFFQGIYGNKVFNQVYRVANSLGEGNYSMESYDNYWREDKPSDSWPRPSVIDNNGNNRVSSRWVQDGSYLRLQNIMLGYTLPKNIINRIKGVDNFRIYVQVQNALTFTKLYGFDPDFINDGTFNRGFSGGSFPSPRTYMVGVKLGL
jgi:TonB-dependent starch-binding outer membrane protein SusC